MQIARVREVVHGTCCRWAFLRDAFGERAPWYTADGHEDRWQWQPNEGSGDRQCHHCDNCVGGVGGVSPDASVGFGGGSGSSLVTIECSALVRVLLMAVCEAQHDVAAGGAVSWSGAIQPKLAAKGSKLQELKAALPRDWQSFNQLRFWLTEVVAVRTDLVARRTLGAGPGHEKDRPYDGFSLTPAGQARLSLFEQSDGAPLSISVPRSLARSLRALATADGRTEASEGSDSQASDDEDDEARLPHSGYAKAIRACPEPGAMLAEGERVAVYFMPPHSDWFDGIVVRSAGTGWMSVRFADGTYTVCLARSRYGRFAVWVLPDATRDEVWETSGHTLLGQACRVHGRDATIRMWCPRLSRFAASSLDEKRDFELTLTEAQTAAGGPAQRAQLPASSSSIGPASYPEAEGGAVVADDAPNMMAGSAAGRAASCEAVAGGGSAAGTAAGEELRSEVSSGAACQSSHCHVPWSLRWELERMHEQSGWQPSDGALKSVCAEWARRDAAEAEAQAQAHAEASPLSDEVRSRHHRARIAAVRHEITKPLVIPWAPKGFIIKYRARVGNGGKVELLEPRKDTRTLAHALFGAEAWLHVEFEPLPEGARERERRAQLRVLRNGIVVCGVRFVFFGAKEGRSLDDCKAYFVAERGEVPPDGRASFGGAASESGVAAASDCSWAWDSVRAVRDKIAAFHSMSSIAKLSKRLCLPFSGSQRALEGFTAQVFDLRRGVGRSVCAAPCLPLSRGSVLLSAKPGVGNVVHIYLVDDITAMGPAAAGCSSAPPAAVDAEGNPMIATDGCGLISRNLAALLPSVSNGLPHGSPDGGDAALTGGLAALGCQMRLYAHGGLAKGLLMTAHSLPDGVVVLTNSQIKVQPAVSVNRMAAGAGSSRGPLFALELIDETRWHRPRYNAQLIPILEAASGPAGSSRRARFCQLLEQIALREAEHVLRLQRPSTSREQTLKAVLRVAHTKAAAGYAEHFGLGTPSIPDMIDAGIDVLQEPYLMEQCQKSIDGALDRIRKGKLPIGEASYVVKGFPDFTGTLAEGQIFLVIDGKHVQPLVLTGEREGVGQTPCSAAIVYRPPGVRAGDVRRVRSVFCPPLADELFGDGRSIDPARASAVYFSVHGAQPLADMLAGGDYDGDDYYVIQERELIELFVGQGGGEGDEGGGGGGGSGVSGCGGGSGSSAGVVSMGGPSEGRTGQAASASAARRSGPPPSSAAVLEEALQAHFLSVRHDASVAVGTAEVNHQAAVDRLGMHHPTTVELGEMYLELLDGKGDRKRHGERVHRLRGIIGPRPRWMHAHRGGDPSWYTAPSESALSRLALCPLGDTRLALRSGGRLRTDSLLRLELHRSETLDDAELQRLKDKWRKLHKTYKDRVKALKRRQEQEEQARERGREARGAANGSTDVDYELEWRDKYFELVAQMREHELLAPYADMRHEHSLAEPPRLLAEACALYEAVYDDAYHATRGLDDPKYYTAFVWHMAGDLLLFVRKARLSRARDPSRALFSNLD